MFLKEIKKFLKQKKRQYSVRRRVKGFKKKIQRLENHKNKMRKKAHQFFQVLKLLAKN